MRKKRSLVIKGLNLVIGDNLNVNTLRDYKHSTAGLDNVTIKQQIDGLGGVASFEDVTFKITDSSNDFLDAFKTKQSKYYISSPEYLKPSTSSNSITLTDDTNPNRTVATVINGIDLNMNGSTNIFSFAIGFKLNTIASDNVLFQSNLTAYGTANPYFKVWVDTSGYLKYSYISGGTVTTATLATTLTTGTYYYLEVEYSATGDIIVFNWNGTYTTVTPTLDSAINVSDYDKLTRIAYTTDTSGIDFYYFIYSTGYDSITSLVRKQEVEVVSGASAIEFMGVSGRVNGSVTVSSRNILRYDLLYLPNETVMVTSGTSSPYSIYRDIFPLGVYQSPQVHRKADNSTYSVKVGVNIPAEHNKRFVAYYEDDVLIYLGYIRNIKQQGKQWDIQTSSIFNLFNSLFKNYIKFPVTDVSPSHNLYGNITVTKDYTAYTTYLNKLKDKENVKNDLNNNFSPASSGDVHFDCDALTVKGVSSNTSVIPDESYLKQVFAPEGLQEINNGSGIYVGAEYPKYAFGYHTSFEVDLPNEFTPEANSLRGLIIKVGDNNYFKITSNTTSSITIETVNNTYGGVVSSDQIFINSVARFKVDNTYNLIKGLIYANVSTDVNPIYSLNLAGLISDYYEEGIFSTEETYDLSSLDTLSDILKVQGLALVLEDGEIKLKSVNTSVLWDYIDIDEGSITQSNITLEHAYFAPVNSLTIKSGEDTLHIEVTSNDKREKSFDVSSVNILKYSTNLTEHFAKVLSFYSTYKPVLTLQIPNTHYEITQAVRIYNSFAVTQNGKYGDYIHGIIIGKDSDYNYMILVNIDSENGYYYHPSIKIRVDDGTSGFETEQTGFYQSIPLPQEAQVIRLNDNTTVDNVTITAVSDDYVTVSGASYTSYDFDEHEYIIVLNDYADQDNSTYRDMFTYIGDAGSYSNGDEVKNV